MSRWRSGCRRTIRCAPIRRITDRALARLSPRFGTLYVNFGRPSIAPEKLLRALLLQALYTIRSERQLMEQLDYNLLFRWFVGLGMDDAVWSPTTFTKNRDRLLDGRHRRGVLRGGADPRATRARLLSDEHFTVDGTLLEAWASHKSFRPRDQDPPAAAAAAIRPSIFAASGAAMTRISRRPIPTRGCTRRRAGARRGSAILGHVLMEHRSGLIVDATVTPADGHGERDAALVDDRGRAGPPPRSRWRPTKAYDTRDFVAELRAHGRHAARRAAHDAVGAARSTAARRAIRATRSVNGSGNSSSKASAG